MLRLAVLDAQRLQNKRLLALLGLLLNVACSSARLRAKPVAPPPHDAAQQPLPCEALLARHRARLLRRPQVADSCSQWVLGASDSPFECKTGAGGTWALLASPDAFADWSGLSPSEDCSLDSPNLRLNLAFRSPEGVERELTGFVHGGDTWGGSSVHLDRVFDFDGDGLDEAVIDELEDGEGFASDPLSVYTARHEAITLHAPAGKLQIEGLEDVDGDARPDLRVVLHTATTGDAGVAGTETAFEGLLHSLPSGTFARDDATTRSFIARNCAQYPLDSPVIRDGETRDDVATGHALVCARRRGISEARILSQLSSSCPAWSDSSAGIVDPEHSPPSQACPNWWRRWLEEER